MKEGSNSLEEVVIPARYEARGGTPAIELPIETFKDLRRGHVATAETQRFNARPYMRHEERGRDSLAKSYDSESIRLRRPEWIPESVWLVANILGKWHQLILYPLFPILESHPLLKRLSKIFVNVGAYFLHLAGMCGSLQPILLGTGAILGWAGVGVALNAFFCIAITFAFAYNAYKLFEYLSKPFRSSKAFGNQGAPARA